MNFLLIQQRREYSKIPIEEKVMKVKSIRLPEGIAKVIEYVSRHEKLEKTRSVRKLARSGFKA